MCKEETNAKKKKKHLYEYREEDRTFEKDFIMRVQYEETYKVL